MHFKWPYITAIKTEICYTFFFQALGIGVITLGSIVIHRSSEYGELLFEGILTLPIWTLLLGIVITLIGFFGCCGAMKENSCMLYTVCNTFIGVYNI